MNLSDLARALVDAHTKPGCTVYHWQPLDGELHAVPTGDAYGGYTACGQPAWMLSGSTGRVDRPKCEKCREAIRKDGGG